MSEYGASEKNLSPEERVDFARRLGIPCPERPRRRRISPPGGAAPELTYLREQREALGGSLPRREVNCETSPCRPSVLLRRSLRARGSGSPPPWPWCACSARSEGSALGRMWCPSFLTRPALSVWMGSLVKRDLVPAGSITSRWTPIPWPLPGSFGRQILQEGICETGAMASFLAAGRLMPTSPCPPFPSISSIRSSAFSASAT